MYLLTGHDAPIRGRNAVAVIDLDGKITTPDTADFLRSAEKSGITRLAGDNLPKSAVLCTSPRNHARHSRRKYRNPPTEVIFTTIASAVILKRSERKRGGL